ncbi:hypothetical protein [Herbidospora sp. RD11066]
MIPAAPTLALGNLADLTPEMVESRQGGGQLEDDGSGEVGLVAGPVLFCAGVGSAGRPAHHQNWTVT